MFNIDSDTKVKILGSDEYIFAQHIKMIKIENIRHKLIQIQMRKTMLYNWYNI